MNHPESREYIDDDESLRSRNRTVGSLASTADDMVIEFGRRFPNYRYGSSPFPRGDDLAERHEIALHNLMLKVLDDKLHTIPAFSPRNVLDIRCGQHALWAKAMSDFFPDTQVTGMDVLPPSSTDGRGNLQLVLQSFSDEEWILDDVIQTHGKFDLVFARSIFGSSQDFEQVYKQCYHNLQPGGYLQQVELDPYASCDDGTMPKNGMINQMNDLIPILEQPLNTDYHLARNMINLIEAAGFIDVRQSSYYAPLSPWHPPGTKNHDIGSYAQRFYETGIQGWLIVPLIKGYQLTLEQVNLICEATVLELRENKQHVYTTVYVVTARKPL